MSNILVPIDFSETSKTATKMAIEWSKMLQCSVTLVHNYRLILDANKVNESPRSARESIVAQKMKKFEAFKKQIGFANAYSLTTKLELGFVIDSIKRMAETGEVDLIIYGVKSKSVPHSTSELMKILDAQLAPILIIHGNHQVSSEGSFDILENKIISFTYEEFKEDMDKHLSTLEKAPNQSLLILPQKEPALQIKSKDSSIADRIVKFSKANFS